MLSLAVTLIALLAAAAMVVRRPSFSLVIVYCVFVFEQWSQAHNQLFVTYSWAINIAAILVIMLGFAVRFSSSQPRSQRWSYGAVATWFLFGFALLSVAWSVNPDYGYQLWQRKAPFLVIFLFLVPWIVREQRDLTGEYGILLLVGFALTLLVFTTTDFSGRSIDFGEGGFGRRDLVARGNPLEVATVASLSVVVAALYGKHGFRGIWGLVRIATLVLGLIVAVKTGSRGQVLAAVAVIIPILMLKNRVSDPKTIASVFVVGVGVLLIIRLAIEHYWPGGRFSAELGSEALGQRFGLATTMLEAWFNDPNLAKMIIGLGNSSSKAIAGAYPHLVPVEILSEAGLIGFAFFTTMILWVLVNVKRALSEPLLNRDEHETMYIALAIFLYFFILMFKQGSLLSSHGFFLSAMILSGLAARRSVNTV